MKTILITGASGFVGKYLSKILLEQGHTVIGLGTSAAHPFESAIDKFTWISADTTRSGDWQSRVQSADVIINLAGRTIFKPWTKAYKKEIYNSRVLTTKHLVAAMGDQWEGQLFSTSAVGFYGDRGDTIVSETDPCGTDFLARLCRDWEEEANRAGEKGAIVSVMRFGVVLGRGGALDVMGMAYKSFVGGPLGSGKQWFSWIHIRDLSRAILFLMEEKKSGCFNFTGPKPLRQKKFSKVLGHALNRPSFMPAPAFMVKAIMGELGSSLLQSQKALPEGLQALGFQFRYADVHGALDRIYKK